MQSVCGWGASGVRVGRRRGAGLRRGRLFFRANAWWFRKKDVFLQANIRKRESVNPKIRCFASGRRWLKGGLNFKASWKTIKMR
jgi:hypothetical protein